MHVQSATNYLNDNAVYYGLAKVGESVGFQDGLDKYFRNQFPSIKDKQNKVKELAKFSEGSMVHPLYVEMQKDSPISFYKEWKTNPLWGEFNGEGQVTIPQEQLIDDKYKIRMVHAKLYRISLKDFYKNHVS
jgi:hypothetical protein